LHSARVKRGSEKLWWIPSKRGQILLKLPGLY